MHDMTDLTIDKIREFLKISPRRSTTWSGC